MVSNIQFHIVGLLEKDEENNFFVIVDNRKINTLTASITYFKGAPGDEVIVLVPKDGNSIWGAVENIIKTNKHI